MKIRPDSVTAMTLRLALEEARIRGVDPAAVLDKYGILDYPEKRAVRRKAVLAELWQELQGMTPTQLGGGRVPATAADMKRAMLDKIREIGGFEWPR